MSGCYIFPSRVRKVILNIFWMKNERLSSRNQLKPINFVFPGGRSLVYCHSSRWPRFRFGFDGKNPMSNKNLVFDEVHNMLALPRHEKSLPNFTLSVNVGNMVENGTELYFALWLLYTVVLVFYGFTRSLNRECRVSWSKKDWGLYRMGGVSAASWRMFLRESMRPRWCSRCSKCRAILGHEHLEQAVIWMWKFSNFQGFDPYPCDLRWKGTYWKAPHGVKKSLFLVELSWKEEINKLALWMSEDPGTLQNWMKKRKHQGGLIQETQQRDAYFTLAFPWWKHRNVHRSPQIERN